MLSTFRRLAASLALIGLSASAQLVSTNLVLEFNAGTDPQGDAVWTDTAGTSTPTQTLTFATSPVRSDLDVAGSNFPVLSVGYATPAYGLNGFFDLGSPVRSTSSGTFELWVNVTNLAAGNDQVIFEAGGADTGISFILSNATLSLNVDGALPGDTTITKTLTTGLHHLVGVIANTNDNLANDSMSLYVDGALAQTISAININDWAGGNISAIGGAGLATNSITGVTAPTSFHGQVAALRYYNRALTAAQVTQNDDVYRARLATYVTGKYVTNNYTVTSNAGFTPTKTRTINGVLYGFNHVVSDGTDGLVATQFLRWDLYTSADNGSTWTFVKTMIDRTDPALTNTIFQSVQFQVTPAGYVGLYMKNLYAVMPSGATDQRKFLTCIFSETPTGAYRVAFNERPFGEPSGDLGNVSSGGQLYIVSANTTDGYINIFNVGARGDSLVAQTLHKQWLLPDNTVDYREAPSLFFQSGYWFLTTSGRTGWRPNQHKYAYATSLAGPWSPLINLGDATGYHSQLYFVATAGANRVFSATRNAPQWGGEGGSTPVWLPMRFNRVPDILATNYYDQVEINYTAGTVEGFQYDRGRQIPVANAKLVGAADDISAIVDGDESTSWNNGAVTTKRTIDLTLGSVSLVKALKIKPLDEWRWTYKVKIYVGDGTTFTQVFPKGSEPPVIPNYAFLGPIDVTPTSGSVVRIENYASYQEGSTNNRFGLYEVQVWGGTASAGAELTESFAAYPTSWVTSAPAGTTATVATVPGDASPSLRLTDTSATNRVEVSKNFSAQNGSQVIVECNYRTDNAASGEFLRLYSGGALALNLVNAQTLTSAAGSATLALVDSDGVETGVKAVTVGSWHALRFEINTDTDTFDLYLDGQLAWLGGKLVTPVNGLDKIMFGTTAQAANVSAYFDDVAVDGPNPAGNTATLDLTDQLIHQVADLQDEVAAQQAVTASLQAQYTSLQSSYDSLNSQYQASTTQVASLQTSLAAAQADAAALRASLDAANAESARLSAALTAAQGELTALRANYDALQAQYQASTAEAASLRAALAAAQAEINTLRTRLDAANAEAASLRTALTAAQDEAGALRSELAAAQDRNATLQAALDAARAENTALTVSLRTTTEQLAATESALASAQASIPSLQASLQAASVQIETLTATNIQLNTSLAQSQALNQSWGAQVAAMTAGLNTLATLLGTDNGDAAFKLPGTTPEAQLAALVQGINALNHGQKQALYQALGGKR